MEHHIRYDVGNRVAGSGSVEYADDEQFAAEARIMERFGVLPEREQSQ